MLGSELPSIERQRLSGMPSTHWEAGKLGWKIVLEVAVALSLTSDESDGSGRQRVSVQLSQSESQLASQPLVGEKSAFRHA